MTDNEKHSSLQRYGFNYARKMFYCEGLQGCKDFTQLNFKINLKLVMAGNKKNSLRLSYEQSYAMAHKKLQNLYDFVLFYIDHLHWRSFLAKLSVTATNNTQVTVTSVLALATLGGVT